MIFALISLPEPSFNFNALFLFLLLLPETSMGLLLGLRLLNLMGTLLVMFFLLIPIFEFPPTLMVDTTSPFSPFCLKVLPPTLNSPTARPALLGLSSHLNFRETLPLPFTTNSDPSPLNLASTPGDDESMLNWAFGSSPCSSRYLIFLRSTLPIFACLPLPFSPGAANLIGYLFSSLPAFELIVPVETAVTLYCVFAFTFIDCFFTVPLLSTLLTVKVCLPPISEKTNISAIFFLEPCPYTSISTGTRLVLSPCVGTVIVLVSNWGVLYKSSLIL